MNRSQSIPEYIDVTNHIHAEQVKSKHESNLKFQENYRKGRLSVVEAQQNMELIDHGLGVLEDSKGGTVWYREGDCIYRQDDEHIENIISAMSSK